MSAADGTVAAVIPLYNEGPLIADLVRGSRVPSEVPVSKTYPSTRRAYSKIRPFRDWWSIVRPIVLLRLGRRR